MKAPARFFVIGLIPISLLLAWIYGCSNRTGGSVGEQLLEASEAAGVEVHREEVFSISRAAETFAVAPIAGWEEVPATDLRNGVNFAFAYFDTAQSNVPNGYYTLRAFADVTDVGIAKARVELIDRQGKVAAEIPAEAEVHSVTVPDQPAFPRSFITTTAQRDVPGGIFIWHRCPNGVCVRHRLFLAPRFPQPRN